ncbi:hypothetical protein K1T71_013798 [Dendrolimus kikuchii]|uniref:Uncharacterized protein n=1 Tax=Dendrolimus kikuchii TaxID=765133 RepID=A0ACC1CG12_9NEOP|nr:hypothetical protein K1T71_013798 [Dendrolimus kikuchii]
MDVCNTRDFINALPRTVEEKGHITRREDTSVERLVVQGKVEGTRARGRSPMRWTDQIKSALNGPLHECTRKATVREEWRRIVKLATTPVMRTTTTLPRV